MRKDNFYAVKFSVLHDASLVGIGRQIHQVSTLCRKLRIVVSAFRQNSPNDGIFVTLWNITTCNCNIVQEEPGVWAVLAHVGEFSFRKRRLYPLRLDDRNQGIICSIKSGKVNGSRHEIVELRQIGAFGGGLIYNGSAAIFFQSKCELS